jgi:hypothetical protein
MTRAFIIKLNVTEDEDPIQVAREIEMDLEGLGYELESVAPWDTHGPTSPAPVPFPPL